MSRKSISSISGGCEPKSKEVTSTGPIKDGRGVLWSCLLRMAMSEEARDASSFVQSRSIDIVTGVESAVYAYAARRLTTERLILFR